MTNADVNSDPTNEQWNLNGRILLGFDGMRKMAERLFRRVLRTTVTG